MGTNYYLHYNACPTCKRGDERHIGKSSAGWCFSLRVYPEDGISTLDDWKREFARSDTAIRTEYDTHIAPGVMVDHIVNREWPHPRDPKFFVENHAVPGPAGLARHKIDGSHCVGHGEGTWDYFKGEFS